MPAPLRWLAYVPCPTRLADSVTLSTFHGCPPGEIAGMARGARRDDDAPQLRVRVLAS